MAPACLTHFLDNLTSLVTIFDYVPHRRLQLSLHVAACGLVGALVLPSDLLNLCEGPLVLPLCLT